jgi:cation diffusion facilitator CzcD-associated flavoprotein CzcO
MPKRDRRISGRTKRLFRRHPAAMRAWRGLLFAMTEAMGPMVILDAPRLKRLPQRASLRHLARSVSDPELRRKLTPRFQFGCKRVLISDDYWSSFERDDVELVTEGIAGIREHAIATRDGVERPTDVIVLATGFALGLATAPFPITGRGGRTLADAWSRGAVAYKGVSVAGFPNWFYLMGPNTGPGHTSVLVYTEAQIAYALQAIRRIRAQGLRWVEVREAVQDRYNRGLQRRMPHTSWLSGCHSWYLGSDGANHALYPGFASEYCLRTRRFVASEYEVAV